MAVDVSGMEASLVPRPLFRKWRNYGKRYRQRLTRPAASDTFPVMSDVRRTPRTPEGRNFRMKSKSRSAALAVLCDGVLTFDACGSDDSSEGSGDSTTITWWNNSNNEPGMGYYEQVAKDFESDHPGVKIEISAMAPEDMVD